MHTLECVEADSKGSSSGDGLVFNFYVHNTGTGIEYHPSDASAHPKMKYLTTVVVSDIPKDRMLDSGFWYMFFKIQVAQSDDHRKEVLYEILLPYVAL